MKYAFVFIMFFLLYDLLSNVERVEIQFVQSRNTNEENT